MQQLHLCTLGQGVTKLGQVSQSVCVCVCVCVHACMCMWCACTCILIVMFYTRMLELTMNATGGFGVTHVCVYCIS